MTAGITIRQDGTAEMAYLEGVARWHGLGNELKSDATLEQWLTAAGLDWEAKTSPVKFAVDGGEYADFDETVPNRVVVYRGDTRQGLGIVSDSFQMVQPREVIEFWRDLTGEAGMRLQTAGTLFGGRRMWALAKVGEAAIIDPENLVQENLLLATAIDGSMATQASYCSTVVVCNNTLKIAQEEATLEVKIPHSTHFNPQRVKQALGVEAAQSAFERTIARMRGLAHKMIREEDAVEMTARLFKPGYDRMTLEEKSRTWTEGRVKQVAQMAIDGSMIGSDYAGYKGTAWGWLNSVTEYVDHSARSKTADHRFDAAMFGSGGDLKERAYAMASAYEPARSGTGAVESMEAFLRTIR